MSRVLHASWQRCRVHFMRNVLAHAGKGHRRLVSAWIGTAFAEADADAACKQWRSVADQLRHRVPKLAALMNSAEADVRCSAIPDTPAIEFARAFTLCEEVWRPATSPALQLP